MAKAAKATLQAERLDAVADRGYFSSEESSHASKAGITVTLPKPMTSNAKSHGRFGKQDFATYLKKDAYRLPGRRAAEYYYHQRMKWAELRRYWTNACQTCALKSRCTTSRGAPDHAVGARARSSRAEEARPASPGDAPAARDGRASLRHHQSPMGATHFLMNTLPRGCLRNGPACTRLQSNPGHEHHGYPAAYGGDQGIIKYVQKPLNLHFARSVFTQPRPVADIKSAPGTGPFRSVEIYRLLALGAGS